MSIKKKYSKPFGDLNTLKTSFFDNNDGMLDMADGMADVLLMQPKRTTCKICGAKLGKPLKVYLISTKTNQGTGELISFKLALIVSDETPNISELECFLYTAVDCDYPYDLVLYKQKEWETLSQDPRTFAWSIRETGGVLYEQGLS